MLKLINDLIGSSVDTIRLMPYADLLAAMTPVLIPLISLASGAVAVLRETQVRVLVAMHDAIFILAASQDSGFRLT